MNWKGTPSRLNHSEPIWPFLLDFLFPTLISDLWVAKGCPPLLRDLSIAGEWYPIYVLDVFHLQLNWNLLFLDKNSKVRLFFFFCRWTREFLSSRSIISVLLTWFLLLQPYHPRSGGRRREVSLSQAKVAGPGLLWQSFPRARPRQ